ncbi:MAG: YbaK/prolyl-tRNA synthetase associated region [Frankiales bacterium]|nr:YbaK/prolyl-tRNA synthetase associated region [Frankiales bacterium]
MTNLVGETGGGRLDWQPAAEHAELLAAPVADALTPWVAGFGSQQSAEAAAIDPSLADTAEFCAAYGIAMDASANCVVVAGKRDGELRYCACLVLATTRADVNGVVRRLLDVRKASFAPMADAVALTSMEYGGITPVGLPAGWPIYVSAQVANAASVVIGSGLRASKLRVPGSALLSLPAAQLVPDLAREV